MTGISDSEAVRNLVADRARSPSERTRLGGASALIGAVALVVFPAGDAVVAIVGALVVLAGWYLLAPTYAFALGHVALAAVLPDGGAFAQGTGLVWVAAVEAGLVGILLASVTSHAPAGFGGPDDREGYKNRERSEDRDTSEDLGGSEGTASSTSLAIVGVVLVLGWVAVGSALAWASAGSLGLPVAGGLLVVLSALAAYGLHRYQLVSLGLVEGDDE